MWLPTYLGPFWTMPASSKATLPTHGWKSGQIILTFLILTFFIRWKYHLQITSCLHSTNLVNVLIVSTYQSSWIQTSQTVGQSYSDTSPYKETGEYSLVWTTVWWEGVGREKRRSGTTHTSSSKSHHVACEDRYWRRRKLGRKTVQKKHTKDKHMEWQTYREANIKTD